MPWTQIGAGLMFLGVSLGAFGAHGLKGVLERHGAHDWWKTAVLYHLTHALGIFVVSWLVQQNPSTRLQVAGWCLVGGIALFSGSLYVMSVTGLRWLGAVTPVGGLLFLVAWGIVLLTPAR